LLDVVNAGSPRTLLGSNAMASSQSTRVSAIVPIGHLLSPHVIQHYYDKEYQA
jgi:hypothetical protein